MKKLLVLLCVLGMTAPAFSQQVRKLQIRRGVCSQLPILSDGEPAWCEDTQEMWIGTNTLTNVLITGAAGISSLNGQNGSTQIFANDTNVTITSSSNTHQLGWAGTLSVSRGGTSNALSPVLGGVIYTDSTKLNVLAAGTSGQVLLSNGAATPSWSMVPAITTLNAQAQTAQVFANDTNVTITSSAGTHQLGWASTLSVSRGGTSNALLPVLGGILYSDSSKVNILAAGTSGQVLVSAGAATPTWSMIPAITSLNSQTGTTQIFGNDTNVIISSSSNTHQLGWAGSLSLGRGGTGSGTGSITTPDGGNNPLAFTTGHDTSGGGAGSGGISETTGISDVGQSGPISFITGSHNNANQTVDISFTTGNSNAFNTGGMSFTTGSNSVSGTSGGFTFTTGTAGTTRGKFKLVDGTEGCGSGCVLTEIDTAGNSHWIALSGTGITSLNAQSGSTQVFANDTNVIITSSSNTHALGWLGTLNVSRGGTSAALSPVLGGLIYTDATKFNVLAAGTSGQILTSNGAAAPTWAANTAITSLNGQTGSTQVFANDTNVVITSAGNTHTLGWASTLGIGRGGTGVASYTSGSIPFSNGTILTQSNANFFWDGTNSRLGIGTNTPTARLQLPAGAIGASSAPLKLGSGTVMTTAESGAIEYDGTNLFYSNSTPVRQRILSFGAGATVNVGGVVFQNSTTAIGQSAAGTAGQILTSSGASAPTWQASNGQSFLTSGTTYTTPSANLSTAVYKVTLIGGGGGGGGTNATNTKGAGGGAGASCIVYVTGVSGGTALTIAIGAAGTAGSGTPTNGGAGGSTTFTANATTYTAAGGGGGNDTTQSNGGLGGACTNTTINVTGAAGGAVGNASTSVVSGYGGSSLLGKGGGSISAAGTGEDGTGFGGGGSGGSGAAASGGAGTQGAILVEWVN